MKEISVPVLKRRLRQTAWLPLTIIVASLLGSVAFILKDHFDERLRNTSLALSDVIDSNQTSIGQEVLLGQPQAVELRLSSILKKWNEKYPTTQACVHIAIKTPQGHEKNIEGCSSPVKASASEILRQTLSNSTQVKIGNEILAAIQYTALRPTTLADLFPPVLLIVLAIALVAGVLAHTLLVKKVERTILEPLLSKISEDERTSAIAETSQMLAHDIRKPLQAIRMALKTLVQSRNHTVREVGERVTLDVESSIRAINAMLTDIIDVSKEMKLTKENISIKSLASSVTEGVLRLYPESKIATIYEMSSEREVGADREKVTRVISNLAENAIQAMGVHGTLRISVDDAFEDGIPIVRVSIANTGPAIEKEDLPNLFAPFFTKKKKGTGLGLAIAKKIVSAHGGTISCHSSELQGTIFSFTLPVVRVHKLVQVSHATDSGMISIQDRTILVFDDEKSVHSAWREHEKNYNFLTFCHFLSWEDFVTHDGFALAKDAVAFVDISYHGSKSNGFDIARALRKLGVRRLYAITSAQEAAQDSGIFDGVFGKEVPKNLRDLVA